MSCNLNPCACGCCAGVSPATPQSLENPPGQKALRYRMGDYPTFMASLRSDLSAAPELRGLSTRSIDDASLALMDSWAIALDVLTFYQERIANEGLLRTATERQSVLELARSIGYELSPGVAASAYLSVITEEGLGAPASVPLAKGIKVKSVPGPDELPQTFETMEEIEARPEWNAFRPRTTISQPLVLGDKQVWLQGTNLNLNRGDLLLFTGGERASWSGDEHWDIRTVEVAMVNPLLGTTYVTWSKPLGYKDGTKTVPPSSKDPRIYVFRRKANAFGYNAPVFKTLPVEMQMQAYSSLLTGFQFRTLGTTTTTYTEWPNYKVFGSDQTLDLDAAYPKILADTYVALVLPASETVEGYRELFRVEKVSEASRAEYALSGKTTRLTLQGEHFSNFDNHVRDLTVYAEPEELLLAPAPLLQSESVLTAVSALSRPASMPIPLGGDRFDFKEAIPLLGVDRFVALSGKVLRLVVTQFGSGKVKLKTKDGSFMETLKEGRELISEGLPLVAATEFGSGWTWNVRTPEGRQGFIAFIASQITLLPAASEDPMVSEILTVAGPVPVGVEKSSRLRFTTFLANIYDRNTVVFCGNVTLATHGETQTEILGSGDASKPFQSYALKQVPLTYVSSGSGAGATSTLEVRVNGVLWEEVTDFYGRGPTERIYTVRRSDDGKNTVRFGDGITGARLPTGSQNITSVYRKGIGLMGEVGAGKLTQPMTRPLGLKSVTNPLPASGSADPEVLEDARENAPLTVLTLGRVVSLTDYEDFSRAFAGIAKAQAVWLWSGERRLVHVTIAPASGEPLEPTAPLVENLRSALDGARDILQPLRLEGFVTKKFRLVARLLIDSTYVSETVFAAATTQLQKTFGFTERKLGQSLRASEVLALLQSVPGVVAADLDALHLEGFAVTLAEHLIARKAHYQGLNTLPAELLILSDNGIELKEMTV